MSTEITVGYWSIRGLGAPLRMMVLYGGGSLKAENYSLKEKEGGGYDASSWFSKKPALKDLNPLMNLPYVIDGDSVISQTNACFTYLGRKFNMLGSSETEMSQCEQLLCEIMDLRNKMTGFAYGPSGDKEVAAAVLSDVAGGNGILQKLELWLSREISLGRSGIFLVGDKASAPDFHLYEMLDQYTALAAFHELPSPLATFPVLAVYKDGFAARPENEKYFGSKLTSLPFNNKMAKFGATLSGSIWVPGTPDYDDASCIYA